MAALLSWWRSGQVTVRIAGTAIRAEVADTEGERAAGLQGKTRLAPGQGMLFVFPHDARWQIWMKDMNISIDIVWLDAHKKVVDMRPSVLPGSYPAHFTPQAHARYVLELTSGTAQRLRLEPGMRAEFTVSPAVK